VQLRIKQMCRCIAKVNADLFARGKNAEIRTNIFGTQRCLIVLDKIDKINNKCGKLPLVAATYCPFCGKRYVPVKS
jgi:hypothetical protein